MPYADPEYLRRWKVANSEKIRAYRVANRHKYVERSYRRNRAFVDAEAQRRGGGCQYPGCDRRYDPDANQWTGHLWHHRDPATKEFAILAGCRRGLSLARIEAELAKCELLCRKHHGARHREISRAARTEREGLRLRRGGA